MSSQHRHSLDDMKALARSKGGLCLSEEFVSVGKKMLWRCGECGHEWEAAPKTILYGYHDSWCPACGMLKRRETQRANRFAALKAFARAKGGECLSDVYVSNDAPLIWSCSRGHSWEATAKSVFQRKTWCRKCRTADRKVGKGGASPEPARSENGGRKRTGKSHG